MPANRSLTPAERWLQGLLWIGGIAMVLAWLFVFLPTAWLAKLNEASGLGEWPEQRVTEYLARTASYLYGMMGVMALGLASDVPRYLPLIRIYAVLAVVSGIVMPSIDLLVGMPWYWIWLEGPPALPYGLWILWLIRHCPAERAE